MELNRDIIRERLRAFTLISWNAAKKFIEDRAFDANGGNAILRWTIESPTHWRGDIVAVRDGETLTAKADLIRRSESECITTAMRPESFSAKCGGNPQPVCVSAPTTTRRTWGCCRSREIL